MNWKTDDEENVVWYYCNHSVFENIMSNHELWLSDITQSNDSNEIYKTLSLLESVFYDLSKAQFYEMGETLLNSLASKFRDNVIKVKNLCIWFAMCFSEKKNSLSQWRTYGENGKGYAIGFRLQALTDIVKNLEGKCREIKIAKIKYVPPIIKTNPPKKRVVEMGDARLKFVYESAQGLCTELSSCGVGLMNEKGQLSEKAIALIKQYVDRLALQFAFFKDDDFRAENEVRICYARQITIEKLATPQKDSLMNSLYFMVKAGEIVPYIKLHIENLQSLINEIIIGPNNTTSENMLKRYLVRSGKVQPKNNFELEGIKVSKSIISCR